MAFLGNTSPSPWDKNIKCLSRPTKPHFILI
jgi:hypothetical protein